MGSEWIRSAAASRVIGHFSDPRPVWLWSGDGTKLLWSNPAALIFRGRAKHNQLKLAPTAIPIKGQVARLIRLGAIGRASLSRLQFESGARPSSATCRCTPLDIDGEETALLIVAVDPVEKKLLSGHDRNAEIIARVFDSDIEFVVVDKNGQGVAGSTAELTATDFSPLITGEQDEVLYFASSQGGHSILVFLPEAPTHAQNDTLEDLLTVLPEAELTPHEELDADAALVAASTDGETDSSSPEKITARQSSGLTSLLDELAMDDALFAPLGPEDDENPMLVAADPPDHVRRALIEFENERARAPVEEDLEEDTPSLWQITGRGFTAEADLFKSDDDQDTAPEDTAAAAVVERGSSRYNFDELSRILTDRVASEVPTDLTDTSVTQLNPASATRNDGALVNLSDENLVLNRLPLGLLVFRDQDILFANRAMTELVGYPDTASLRGAGLAAIFPTAPDTIDPVGPITRLLHRDQVDVPVAARLQVISWQGQSAFMLTAKHEITPVSTEESVRAFAETLAATEGSGFFEASRAGIIDAISERASALFERTSGVLIGRPLMILVGHKAAAPLRDFLEQPARFAETKRPGIMLDCMDSNLQILLFAEGQAGIVTGYFGIVQQRVISAPSIMAPVEDDDFDSAMLGRLSRGMRRPLNTIVGFAELIRSRAFGPIENHRYVEYAGDIKSAGNDIAEALDELEEFTELSHGEYEAEPELVDLGTLLDKCLSRVRGQANQARVLVRSGISLRLPKVRVDEPSLSQAVLNLLASAIEQTPEGGQVVVSAQRDEDGTVFVHVRDSGIFEAEMAERFVVFRDGFDLDGEVRKPIKSSVGLALTRSLLAVNTCTLSIDPTPSTGTLLTLAIPANLARAAE